MNIQLNEEDIENIIVLYMLAIFLESKMSEELKNKYKIEFYGTMKKIYSLQRKLLNKKQKKIIYKRR